MEQIQRNLDLIEQGKITFASEDCWSDETNEYNELFENELFEDQFDDWEEGEEND